MFSGTFSGLLIVGNLKPIGLSYGAAKVYATIAISMFAIGNSLGRIIWGRIMDSHGGKKTITTALLVMAVVVVLVLVLSSNSLLFIIVALLVGFGFSANFVLFATEVTHIYGIENLNNIYPSVHLSYGVAEIIGPIIGGKLFDINGSYDLAIIIATSISAIGAVAYITIRSRNKNQHTI